VATGEGEGAGRKRGRLGFLSKEEREGEREGGGGEGGVRENLELEKVGFFFSLSFFLGILAGWVPAAKIVYTQNLPRPYGLDFIQPVSAKKKKKKRSKFGRDGPGFAHP
jgi:hypothetical protein